MILTSFTVRIDPAKQLCHSHSIWNMGWRNCQWRSSRNSWLPAFKAFWRYLAVKHKFDNDPSCSLVEPTNERSSGVFQFRPVTNKDVGRVTKVLPSNKAPGYDQVSTWVLKDSLSVILPLITVLWILLSILGPLEGHVKSLRWLRFLVHAIGKPVK